MKKNVASYEKRKKNNETKLPPLWNHHKIGFVGSCIWSLCVDSYASQYKYFGFNCICYLLCVQNGKIIHKNNLIHPLRYPPYLNFLIPNLLNPTTMTKLYSLFGGRTTDTEVKAVTVNQVIQMEGYSYDRYVVYKITHEKRYGYHYHLINLRTLDMQQSEIIKPLSQKFGIGMYYDENNIEFKSNEEVAELYAKAQEKKVNRIEKEREDEKQREATRVTGREWLEENLPEDAQAIIIACLKQDESDSQTDYYASRTTRTVIIGFSKHKKDIFSEMRKHASNFEETAHLANYNEDYEHREKYSMGHGYYLGESYYSGWIIKKAPIYNRENTIKEFSYVAGCSDGIYLKKIKDTHAYKRTCIGEQYTLFEIVDYSEKSIALFGDTKPIKDLLKAMGGRFNPRLIYKADKRAGWVFQISKREELDTVLRLKAE